MKIWWVRKSYKLDCGGLLSIIMLISMLRVTRIGQPLEWDELPIQPILPLLPFEKWIINFFRSHITSEWKLGASYIITNIEYITQWVEAGVVKDYTA